MLKKLLMTAVVAGAFALPASAATIVTNGSFEEDPGSNGLNGHSFADLAAPGGANWDIFTSAPGWAVVAGDGLELQTAETIPLTPYDGDYYAELDGNQNSTINQTITMGVGNYVLSFAFSPREASTTTNQISFGINNIFTSDVNGPSLTYPLLTWTVVEYAFSVAAAGDYTLFFDAASNSDSLGGFIDGIQVAAVPVPAAGLMLIAGLGGLGALRRRRKAA